LGKDHGAVFRPSREEHGNDIAADCQAWQAWSLQCKLSFAAATLAGPLALIKDSGSHWLTVKKLKVSYDQSR
jgi:hypothetical protein